MRLPREAARAMAYEYRLFAHANPGTYTLLIWMVPEEWRVDSKVNQHVSGLLLRPVAQLSRPAD